MVESSPNIPVQRRVDLHIEYAAGVPGNRESLWHTLGIWQLKQLKYLGLNPGSHLLDVGCGPLRLGMYVIPFLEDDHFWGVDPYAPYEKLAKAIMKETGCRKKYTIKIGADFPFVDSGRKFDFAMAQSVVTHLSNNQLDHLMTNLKRSMAPGGQFVFTYTDNPYPYGIFYEMEYPMITPAGLNDKYFSKLAERFEIEYLGCPGGIEPHPTGQRVGVFQF